MKAITIISSIKKFIISRKTITVLLISLALVAEFIFAHIYCRHSTNEFIEILYYSSQIISSIFVISGVVIAVWQYYLSSKSIKRDLAIQQVQRAIDLSEYYKDNILKYYPAIEYIFKQTGISEIIETLRIDQLHDFDENELKKLFSLKQIEKLKAIQSSDEFSEKTVEACLIYGLDDIKGKAITISDNRISGSSVDKVPNSIVVAYISTITNKLLNDLEFFSLHFSHRTADKSVVYQSLHQTYLKMIQYLYYDIAVKNTDSTSKYFTNIIWLFNAWRDKKTEQNTTRDEMNRTIMHKGTVIDKNA